MQVEFVPGGKDHGWYFKDGHGCVLMAHGEPVPLLVAHEIAGRLSSGWMPWHGGLIPAGAHGQRVDIQFRDGEIFQNRPAGDFSWHHFDIEGDIVFWRVSPLPAVPGEHAQGLEAKLAAGNAMATQLEQQPVAGLAADAGIDGMEAYEAWHRVKGLAESGATPQIDAHDVLGALVFCERESKALLEKKTSAGRAYENHIAWLEDQLAKARASTGGSRELVAAAISIRDRLVDYFRYVAEGLPFERQTESNERAQSLINGLGLLANDLEAGRLADQCTRLHRNQLMGELDEARVALDASQGQVKQLEAEVAELRDLADRQAGLLSRTAVAIRGPEPDLARWSHHDLPELAAAMRKQRDICASAANKIQWATPDYSHQEGVCPECGQYEHDGHGEGCMVGRACGIYDVLRLTGALK